MNKCKKINSSDPVYYKPYGVIPVHSAGDDDAIIDRALEVLDSRLKTKGALINTGESAKLYLRLRLQQKERECFAVMFLDAQHNLIEYDEMFHGTINKAAVYPREIARKALKLNASALIIAHNHPSGDPKPSSADKILTGGIKEGLSLFDINLLDHIIIAGDESSSFAELGLI